MSRAGIRDLQHWQDFDSGLGRPIQDPNPVRDMHSDASDLGYGLILRFVAIILYPVYAQYVEYPSK